MKTKYYWFSILKNMSNCDINKILKREVGIRMSKKKIDKSKIFGRILAGLMAGLMLVGFCISLVYYLIRL